MHAVQSHHGAYAQHQVSTQTWQKLSGWLSPIVERPEQYLRAHVVVYHRFWHGIRQFTDNNIRRGFVQRQFEECEASKELRLMLVVPVPIFFWYKIYFQVWNDADEKSPSVDGALSITGSSDVRGYGHTNMYATMFECEPNPYQSLHDSWASNCERYGEYHHVLDWWAFQLWKLCFSVKRGDICLHQT